MIFTFKCDSTSLDFAGTVMRRHDETPTDLLPTPAHLAAWFAQSGIVDAPLDITDADLERAIVLREAVWAVVASHLEGTPYPAAALAAVNEVAAGPAPVPSLDAHGRHISATPNQALSAIAREAIAILSGTDIIKECSLDGCTQVFVDRSRGSRREWCSMDPCGNRAKAREYRARKAAAA